MVMRRIRYCQLIPVAFPTPQIAVPASLNVYHDIALPNETRGMERRYGTFEAFSVHKLVVGQGCKVPCSQIHVTKCHETVQVHALSIINQIQTTLAHVGSGQCGR